MNTNSHGLFLLALFAGVGVFGGTPKMTRATRVLPIRGSSYQFLVRVYLCQSVVFYADDVNPTTSSFSSQIFCAYLPSHIRMESGPSDSLAYKRARFSTHLPKRYLYSPSHFWLEEREGGILRVGFTKFSTRMLGELVDHGFEPKAGDPVEPGKIIGWVEGFKAISDLYCVGRGAFAGVNPRLQDEIETIGKSPYRSGWLYEIKGQPDERCFSVDDYAALLDKTIDKILEKEMAEEGN